jgi:YidC/Oxa1 family membrane protein insertase
VIAVAAWQALLDGLGWVLAHIYQVIPNYGVTIIILTLVIRLLLLPLGIKQIRSMQHMQLIQPKVKQIQQKYRQDKARQQEEIMKLYKEYGVNPFSGCWPVLLQFPILIAMYMVLRHPQHPLHIPESTRLYQAIQQQIPQPITSLDQVPERPGPPEGTSFLGVNLLCSATQAGNPNAQLGDSVTVEGKKIAYPVNCGDSALHRIPYYLFAALMVGTTYFQQRQMQKASPPGAASPQQQALLRVMPLMFGVFGVFFPAGLVLYWTTSNVLQIGQQHFMLRSRPTAEQLAERAAQRPGKKGLFAQMAERAEEERKRRGQAGARSQQRRGGETKPPRPGKPGQPGKRSGKGKARRHASREGEPGKGEPGKGQPQGEGKPQGEPLTGGSGGGDPGERPER